MAPARPRGLGQALLLGFGVASAGGPLAIVALYLPQTAGLPAARLTLGTLAGIAWFLAPLWVWASYSRRIASAGGLYAFVREAAGARLAAAQALLWAVAYFLYLPYTVAYVVFYLAPWVLRGIPPFALDVGEVALPVAIGALVSLRRGAAVAVLGVSAAAQLAAIVLLGVAVLHGGGGHPAPTAVPWPGPAALAASGARIGSLFICLSLVCFLGGEAAGGAGAVRRALIVSFAIAAAAVLFGAVLLRHGAAGDIPGMVLAQASAGRGAGLAIGVGVMASVAGLVVAEYVALGRLWHAATGIPLGRAVLWIGAVFVAVDAASLLGPRTFYAYALPPSLLALFLSQAIVFAVHPRFARRTGRLTAGGVAVAALACIWAAYGAYGVLARGAGP